MELLISKLEMKAPAIRKDHTNTSSGKKVCQAISHTDKFTSKKVSHISMSNYAILVFVEVPHNYCYSGIVVRSVNIHWSS
jgi:hypothetical protein